MNFNRFSIKLLALIFCCLGATMIQAQLSSEEIVVVKDFDVKVADARKLNFIPQIESFELKEQLNEYRLQNRVLDVEFKPNPLKPIAMPKEKVAQQYNSFIKLGFGNLLRPYAELRYNDKASEKMNYGAWYTHHSADGALQLQKHNDNSAGIYFTYFFKNLKIKPSVSFDRQQNHYFAYAEIDSVSAKALRQHFTEIKPSIQLTTTTVNKLNLDYDQNIQFSHTSFRFPYLEQLDSNSQEFYFSTTIEATKIFNNKHFVQAEIWEDYSQLSRTAAELNRNIFGLKMAYIFNNDDWKLRAGLQAVAENEDFHLFPDLLTEKRLYEHKLIFYSQWMRKLQKNSLLSLVRENPFIFENIEIKNTRIEDRIAGFKGTLNQFQYNARFSNKVIKQYALFVNDTNRIDRFNVIYDRNTIVINLHAEISYDFNKKVRLGFEGDFFDYEPTDELKAWYKPTYDANLYVKALIKEKLSVKLETYALGGAYARLSDGTPEEIEGIIDANLNLEYNFSKYFSLFADANNILGTKYECWKYYPNYGFNGLIGFTFKY